MSNKKILIVDDEANVRSLVSRIIGDDYIVLEATDGNEAVRITREAKPDLVLLDIMMPNKDGYTVLSEIRNNPDTESIPVVIISAVGLELNRKLGMTLGANGYMTKPFSYQDLLDTVRRFLKASKVIHYY